MLDDLYIWDLVNKWESVRPSGVDFLRLTYTINENFLLWYTVNDSPTHGQKRPDHHHTSIRNTFLHTFRPRSPPLPLIVP